MNAPLAIARVCRKERGARRCAAREIFSQDSSLSARCIPRLRLRDAPPSRPKQAKPSPPSAQHHQQSRRVDTRRECDAADNYRQCTGRGSDPSSALACVRMNFVPCWPRACRSAARCQHVLTYSARRPSLAAVQRNSSPRKKPRALADDVHDAIRPRRLGDQLAATLEKWHSTRQLRREINGVSLIYNARHVGVKRRSAESARRHCFKSALQVATRRGSKARTRKMKLKGDAAREQSAE